ncbi:MAG TPA: hypothetical protein VJ964_00300 [Balneolaceae bacterium]|nr:hypothetical protein [Balneolaceae bacterium]
MVNLDLSQSELDILKEILDTTISDLRMEIADTDKYDHRELLKKRKRVLEKTVKTIEEADPKG